MLTDDVPRQTAPAPPATSTRHHLAVIPLAGVVAFAAASCAPRAAEAQMLATPVLQNAFVNRGLTLAGNFGSEGSAKTYGAAAAWAPRSERYALSAGVGAYKSGVDAPTRVTYGGRLAVSLRQFMDGALGVAAFVGFGGAAQQDTAGRVNTLPAGVAVGYRRALGSALGLAVYAAPFYTWWRGTAVDGGTVTASYFRASGGVDLSLSRHVGVTFGVELGAEAKGRDPGPRSAVFGVGLSYAFQ